MTRKWLRRLVTILMIAVGIYFAHLATETPIVPIEKTNDKSSLIDQQTIKGSDVHYRAFDAQGNEIAAGTSRKVTLIGEEQFQLEEGLELEITRDGRKYQFKADRLENQADGSKIMSVDPGNQIFLSIPGELTIKTEGPLAYGPDGVIQTDAPTSFFAGEIRGQCVGLRYRPQAFLELLGQVSFRAESGNGDLQIESGYMILDFNSAKGQVDQGTIISRSTIDQQQNFLVADQIQLDFQPGLPTHFRLAGANLSGEPATFGWRGGEMQSELFEACFESNGKVLNELVTGWRANFSSLTQEGRLLRGKTGSLRLLLERGEPQSLRGNSSIDITAEQKGRPNLILRGDQGILTEFFSGHAYSTRIFGDPAFEYGTQQGRAGSLRVLHDERKILFSDGAQLQDSSQNLKIKGDEILLADWDQEEKEIFAFRFVEIVQKHEEMGVIESMGDQMQLRLPSGYLELRGEPAEVRQQGRSIQAKLIQIDQAEDGLLDMKTEGQVRLELESAVGKVEVLARSMDFSQERNLLTFRQVSRAVIPERGQLSCQLLSVGLTPAGRSRPQEVEYMTATKDVIYNGQLIRDDSVQTFSCQADELHYRQDEARIHFRGTDNDVVVTHPSYQYRGKELTYDLKDGSMRVDSVEHGISTTTVNLKDQLKN